MKKTAIPLLAAFAYAALAASAATFNPSSAPVSETRAKISVLPGCNMPVAEGVLDGKKVRLLVDTGATHTTISKTFWEKNFPDKKTEKVGLRGISNVSMAPSLGTADALSIGEAVFKDFCVMIYPLESSGSEVISGFDGVLAMNVLGATRTILSLGGGEIVFCASDASAAGFEYADRDPSDPLSINVRTPRGQMIVDSGASFTIIDAKTGWPAENETVAGFQAASINGSTDLAPKPGKPGMLRLKGGAGLKIVPLVAENAPNCIGSDVLLRYDLLIDSVRAGFRERVK